MRFLRLALVFVLGTWGVMAVAQTPSAPVPPALYAAKKVFISNAGGDSGLFPHPFSGSPSRAYDAFYAGVKQLGRFDLVSDPTEADLVLEIQLTAPNGPTNANKQKGASDPLPMMRLVVWDRKTHFVLWALTESIDPANLQKTHDRNFDDAVAALVAELKNITSARNP
ncbi:hypothetical protein [Edaphobacter flagellatus]|uniref:hypothetical protein n=1 Tax=Edaphobacter flagellatus TaxID=1933044 RepID=UPI0021B1D62E|nr:hypothetical protein [Edaphobacter flagellatus]